MKLNKNEFIDKIFKLAQNIGLELNTNQLEAFYMYKELVIEWNNNINLTAIVDDDEFIIKHIIDSLQVLKYIKQGQSIIDVGTGAGLPGVIIAIYFEGNVKVTLLDALNKRVDFLNEVIKSIGLKNVQAVHGRAEEKAREINFREQFDVVISRAVAVLNILIELTAPFVKVGGCAIYMKSERIEEEILKASNASKEMCLVYTDIKKYELQLDEEIIIHTLLLYKKNSNVNNKYPRQFSKIKKNPL